MRVTLTRALTASLGAMALMAAPAAAQDEYGVNAVQVCAGTAECASVPLTGEQVETLRTVAYPPCNAPASVDEPDVRVCAYDDDYANGGDGSYDLVAVDGVAEVEYVFRESSIFPPSRILRVGVLR